MTGFCPKGPLLALPVSHLMAQKSDYNQKLLDISDVLEIKSYPVPEWIPINGPKVFHWDRGTCEDSFARDFPPLGQYLAQNPVDLFSFDLGPACALRKDIYPVSPVLSLDEILDISRANLKLVRRFFSGNLAAENYNYFPTGLYENICEPENISFLLDNLQIDLVLDLAHAAVTAHNLGLNLESYLTGLPLNKVKEIHLSRPLIPDNPRALASDDHQCPRDGELNWLILALELLPQEARWPLVTIEYYKEQPELLNIMTKTRQILKRYFEPGQKILN
ncbi:MAG: DUF692 family protein [Deltaproteobacteria bacterium]|nr:DUF692 family protein [Deltaproteobacteria bacterium]